MDEKQNIFVNPMPHAMRNGISLGLLFSANFILSAGESAILQAMTYIVIMMIAVYIWKAVVNFRDKESDGAISFYRAFSYIFLLVVFASLISAIVKLIYLRYINTNYLDKLFAATQKFVEAANLQMPEGSESALRELLDPVKFTMNTLMADMLLGTIAGLLYAPFVRKKQETK